MVAYPRFIASYTVPVCQYRILQSRFLQIEPHGSHPCDLLTLPGATLVCKGLPACGRQVTLWKICTLVLYSLKKICIFDLFLQLTTSVRCMMLMQGTHEPSADIAGQRGK